ncbi:MAG TPA: hypothetical protein VNR42_01250 [Solirubrobacteraceae bacterium]|nr:hypothetical protein [Solirubrobacteraceae bacterium]
MAEQRHNSTEPDPSEVKLDGFPEPEVHRAIFWDWGHDASSAGSFTDSTHLYIAQDDEGETRWWRQIIEDTVGHPGEAEQISFEEVLNAAPAKYWPIVFSWTLEAAVSEIGWHDFDELWRELLSANPDAKQQLKEILVALMPKDTEEARRGRRLDPAAAEYHEAVSASHEEEPQQG